MKDLIDICGYYQTDKNTVHSYVTNFYNENFKKYKETAKNVLEVGVYTGGSCRMWKEYFSNSNIYGIDISVKDENLKLLEQEDIKVLIADAYTSEIADQIPELDIAIDDGPHTLLSMIQFIKLYLPKIKSGGILVIEDVQDPDWFLYLVAAVPEKYKNIQQLDYRFSKNRYDDLMFVIHVP